tara:strand:- start:389 stop:709 length:321 start_codon:yes stop_codon:yes gene_type:complete
MAYELYGEIEGVLKFPIDRVKPVTSMASFREATVIDMEEATKRLKAAASDPTEFTNEIVGLYMRAPAVTAQCLATALTFYSAYGQYIAGRMQESAQEYLRVLTPES